MNLMRKTLVFKLWSGSIKPDKLYWFAEKRSKKYSTTTLIIHTFQNNPNSGSLSEALGNFTTE
jgi:hypothetical protein